MIRSCACANSQWHSTQNQVYLISRCAYWTCKKLACSRKQNLLGLMLRLARSWQVVQLWAEARGVHSILKHGRSLRPRKTEGGRKIMHIFTKVWNGKIGGRLSYFYSLPRTFSKIFSLATLARLHFIIQLKCKHATWLYQPQLGLYVIVFLMLLSLAASFQNALKHV